MSQLASSAPSDAIVFSATQIKLGDECLRKWGFKYLEGIYEAQGAGAALGTETQDTQLDPWLGAGRSFDFSRPSGEIANALVPLLPRPNPELAAAGLPLMQLRRKFWMPSPTGLWWYQGEFDIYSSEVGIVPGGDIQPGALLLGDIKTTKDLGYALSEEGLLEDVQAQLYSMNIMYAESVDTLDLVWWYARTKAPHRVKRVYVPRLRASHVVEQFQKIEAKARVLAKLKIQAPAANDLPPNVRACDSYGGCKFNHLCNLSPLVQAEAVNTYQTEKEETPMNPASNDFLANLRKAVPAAAALPAPVNMGNPHPMAARSDIPPAPAPAPETAGLPAWATAPVDPLTGHVSKTVAVNPPESALPPAPPIGAAAPVQPPAEAPKRRGRPPKDPNAPSSTTINVFSEAEVGAMATDNLTKTVETMRLLGVKRYAGGGIEVELFPLNNSGT